MRYEAILLIYDEVELEFENRVEQIERWLFLDQLQ